MPTSTKAWIARDGTLYTCAEQAARRDLFNLLSGDGGVNSSEDASRVIDALVTNADLVIEALTTGSRSKPRARKAAGTTNPRRAARRASAAQAKEGFRVMREAANGAEHTEPEPAGAD